MSKRLKQEALGMNAYHHHRGVLPSTIPAMASESQPGPWLFSTSGMRSNSGAGGARLKPGAGWAEGASLPAGGVMTVSTMACPLLAFGRMFFTGLCGGMPIFFGKLLRAQRLCLVIGHVWIWVADPRQIGQAGLGMQKLEHRIIAGLLFQFGDAAAAVFDVPKGNSFGGAGLLASGLECAIQHFDVAYFTLF